MQVRSYKLTKLAIKDVQPSKIAVFDIESIDWIESYALGFYDGQTTAIFEGKECVEQFIKMILQKKYRSYLIYAHNGGRFDFNFLLEVLRQEEYKKFKVKVLRIGSRITQLTIHDKNKHSWTLRDSMGFFGQLGGKSSLESLTKNFDVETKKGKLEHEKINWENYRKLSEEWKPYLIDDCKGLYQVMTKFQDWLIQKFNVNLKKNVTIAQTAMNVFRTNYLKEGLVNHRAAEEDIRKSYKGGRTEVFERIVENANYYDINSLYPYVMKEKPVPIGTPIKSYMFNEQDFGVAYITATCPKDLEIPVLPVTSKTGKLIFPTGTFKGWYCSPEIQLAISKGYEIKIHYGYKFQQGKIFSEYIDDLYEIKQNAERNSVDYLISKLLMNSLYGKFGQRREKRMITMNPESFIGVKPINDYMVQEEVISESSHILPAIASFITSYARCELYKLLDGNQPIYCDTDSVITKKVLPTGEELGELKLEMQIKEGVFILPKMYAILDGNNNEYIRIKGFSKANFSYQQIKNCLISDDYTSLNYVREKFALPFESMKRNKSFLSMVSSKRSVKTKYDKREVVGMKTLPINISLEDHNI